MRLFLSIVAVAVFAGCTAQQKATYARAETSVAKALISDQQEDEIGAQVHQELSRGSPEQPPLKFSTDPVVTNYVQGLLTKIAPFAEKDRAVAWKVFVIDDPKTVNAFATPGAYIYVYTGLLVAADTESEVIGVMGHEMGHVVGRHSARQMVNALGLNTIGTLALGQDPGTVAKVAASLVGNGTMLAHSRADENEADQYAVRYSAAAGSDASGIATFFEKLRGQQGNTPRAMTWLMTHPAPADRIVRVNQTIEQLGLAGRGDIGAGRLEPIKARINSAGNVSQR